MEDPSTLRSMNNLAEALSKQGKHAEAAEMHRETLRLKKKVQGEEYSETQKSMNNLAYTLRAQNHHDEALHLMTS